jgi:hypothetical protein
MSPALLLAPQSVGFSQTFTAATSLDWKISAFGKSLAGLLTRYRGYIEFETLGGN